MLYQLLLTAQLLAQSSGEEGPRGYSISWAIILLGMVLGIFVAVRPAKREDEVKKPKPD